MNVAFSDFSLMPKFCSFSALRLDLVPINRSVGLKAKPTKPVTEVLRPVVAKYGLHLSDLVAKIVSRPRWLQCHNLSESLVCSESSLCSV